MIFTPTFGVGIGAICLTLLYAFTQVIFGYAALANVARPVSEAVTAVITVSGIGFVAVAVAVVTNVASIAGGSKDRKLVEIGILFIIIPGATVIHSASGASYIYLAVFVALTGVIMGMCIANQAVKGYEKYALIYSISVALAALGGTSFRGADLTDADFTNAVVGNTDFRDAIITCTRWFNTKKIDYSIVGESYLKNTKLQKLVTDNFTNTADKNFDNQNLREINLSGYILENASFIDANLYKSNLQNADLSRAKLVRSQMESADLRGATLTGACIEDWLVTRTTKLDGIKCEYIFLKFENGQGRDQMPPRGKFKEGGFVTFVKYIMETVELYHEKDINPRLALTVLQKMAIDYDEPLNVVAVGMRDERVFMKVKVSESIIRDQFKTDYYSRYDNDLKLWSSNPNYLPPAIDNLIENKLREITSEKADDFVFVDVTHVEGNYTQIYKGEVNMTGDRYIQMGRGNYNEKIEGNYIQGNYYAAGEKQSLAQAAAEIQQLLEQLDKTYSANTTASKMELATEAIKCIDSNPALTARIISALQAGSVKAFEQFLSHPAASFVIAALEDWQKTKGS